jgi:hypothetical protein
MRSGDGLQAVLLTKLGGDVHAERVAGTSGAHSPTCAVFGIRPK